MSLRTKALLYLVVVHIVFLAGSAILLRSYPAWLLATEFFFVLSLWMGIKLLGSFFEPLRMIRSGINLLQDRDFTTRFRDVDEPEVNELVQVYNRMAAHLREERIRNEEQEHFLQSILAVSATGVVTLDLDGRVAAANESAARMLGKPSSELHGRTMAEIGTTFATALSSLEEDEVRVVTLRGRHRVRCRRVGFLDRGFTRSSYILEEFTEEYHRAEREAYGKLIRMMSHEVNNTTGAVNSLLGSCLNYRDQISEADAADYVRALEVAISRNEQMNSFMRGFADVIRLPQPRLSPTDLRPILDRLTGLYAEELRTRDIDVRSEIDPSLPEVVIDEAQIEQVLVNVFKNAMESIGSHGTIKILAYQGDRSVVLEVCDTGSGISPSAANQLFTSFFTTKENGQGIGLTLVREILRAHHCEFSLERPPGEWTRFRVSFPISAA